jgi:hypothetical protein
MGIKNYLKIKISSLNVIFIETFKLEYRFKKLSTYIKLCYDPWNTITEEKAFKDLLDFTGNFIRTIDYWLATALLDQLERLEDISEFYFSYQ